jgi:hypothetical protein
MISHARAVAYVRGRRGAVDDFLQMISHARAVAYVRGRRGAVDDWGFDTQEEWYAWQEKLAKEDDEKFHAELSRYLRGEPNDIRPGSVGMGWAEEAKKLVESDPTLLLPENKVARLSEITGPRRSRRPGDDANELPPHADPLLACGERENYPHTSFAISTIILSFAHCSSSARMLPSSVEAKPHCGDKQS